MTDKKKVRETVTPNQNYAHGGKGPNQERGAITKNSVKKAAGSNTYPYGSGQPKGAKHGDGGMPKASKQGPTYAFKHPDGSKTKNPAMDRRDKARYVASKTYAHGKDGSTKMNPEMNEESLTGDTDNTTKKNPTMDDRVKARYVSTKEYASMHDGTTKKNPAMNVRENRIFRSLLQRKKMLEMKLKEVRASQRPSLARLIEDEMLNPSPTAVGKSTLYIAAKGILSKMQKMATDMSSIETDDLMPMMENMPTAFGPDIAKKFDEVTSAQLRQALQAIKTAKEAINSQVDRLGSIANGNGPGNDMADDTFGGGNDEGMGDQLGGAQGGAQGEDPLAEPPLADDGIAPDMAGGSELPDGDLDLDAALGDDPIGAEPSSHEGRARKESARNKRPPLKEDSHESTYLDGNLQNLGGINPRMLQLGQTIRDEIAAAKMSDSEKRALANVLSHLAAYASSPSRKDAETWIEDALDQAGIFHVSPDAKPIVNNLKKLAHMIVIFNESVMSNNINRLRTSPDPDRLIFEAFRRNLKEYKPIIAAKRVAESYSIDFVDVVSIIKEAKKGVPPQFQANIDKMKAKAKGKDKKDDKKADAKKDVKAGAKKADAKKDDKKKTEKKTEMTEAEAAEDLEKEEAFEKRKAGSHQLNKKRRTKAEVEKATGRKVEEAIKEADDKRSADAAGRIMANVLADVKAGKNNPMINPQDLNTLKQAAQKDRNTTAPLRPNQTNPQNVPSGDQNLAAKISNVVQKAPTTENAEGKMPYPISIPQKRDADPRHPVNKGVSARRGFVGG